MTVSSQISKAGPYNGNGATTSFPFGFQVFTAADIDVILTDINGLESTLGIGADYSVNVNADQSASPGGSVVCTAAPPSGYKLTILRALDMTQGASLQNQGGFYPKVIENALDKLTMLAQQNAEGISRAVSVPASSGVSPDDYLTTLNAYRQEALASASAASTSEANAAASEIGAAGSATAANTSAANAATSETNAAASASAASTSETNAASSASSASASATTATTQATNAAASASAAAGSAAAAAGYLAPVVSTSSTSLAIGTGSKSFTTGTGLNWAAGMPLKTVQTSNPTVNYMTGNVVSYNSGTGALVMNATAIAGSGTVADWTLSLQGGAAIAATASLLKGDNAGNAVAATPGTDYQAAMAAASQAEMEAGTEANLRSMSPLRVAQAIAALVISTPVNSSPANAATINVYPLLTVATPFLSLYGAGAPAEAQWQVSTSSTFETTVVDATVSCNIVTWNTYQVGAVLNNSTTYYWRMRVRAANTSGFSNWSAATSFTTAASWAETIATPTATPSIGAALEGGFYAGMIWNQIAQSSTSIALGTGSKVFTVPSMTGFPIVYVGQALEVRSRANPANKFIGTVTAASGTSLTINVSSIGGSGTFADWSIMSKFRVIVSPAASGDNLGIQIKNTNSALPAACQTLTEGWAATNSMIGDGGPSIYPAAYWARTLSINGYADWYIPARDELELLWRNLKPTTDSNYVTADRSVGASWSYANNGSYGDTANTHGLNNNSSPTGAAYIAGTPGQTEATAFRTGGAEAMAYGSYYYWSSTDYSATYAWSQNWHSSNPGSQYRDGKTSANRLRVVRRSII